MKILLLDESLDPTDGVLRLALGNDLFSVYQATIECARNEFNLIPEWRYYKDGHSWLCKITDKKRTICWLSVWEHAIKISFYFTDKTRPGILDLDIDPSVKSAFMEARPIGKLIPLVLEMNNMDQIMDLKALIGFKKGTK